MSSRLSGEQLRIINSGCPLANHSLNQRALKKGIEGQSRLNSLSGKAGRVAARQARQAEAQMAEAARQVEEQLDILFDDLITGQVVETIVATVEGREGFVHEVGIVYVEGSSML